MAWTIGAVPDADRLKWMLASSDSSDQDQNQHDHHDQPQTAGGEVAPGSAVAPIRQGADQGQDQNHQQNRSKHRNLPGWRPLPLAIAGRNNDRARPRFRSAKETG